MTTTETTTMRAWVGCLGCYNEGRLVGKWVDGVDAENVTVAELHREHTVPTDIYTAMHEELWCFDHEGYGAAGEFSPMEASRRARYFDEAEDDGCDPDAVKAWIGDDPGSRGEDWSDDADSFKESYMGQWDSGAKYAEEFYYETGSLTDESPLAIYIDWERVWHGEFECGDYWSAEAPDYGGVYIFRAF